MSKGVPAMWMRGGTSKGLYFLKEDIPSSKEERDNFLLSVFGSPDALQINGIGGKKPNSRQQRNEERFHDNKRGTYAKTNFISMESTINRQLKT